jgi:hypothetical protein
MFPFDSVVLVGLGALALVLGLLAVVTFLESL